MCASPDSAALRRAAAELLLEGMVEAGLKACPMPQPSTAACPGPHASPEATADALKGLEKEICQCQACPLAATRQHAVPGEGSSQAQVLFVGEGPGADEDASGRPFVGAAGQLLDKIITAGMGLSRSEVFIANIVKCRPPGNRTPAPEEVEACSGYLERQILALQPRLIIALGRTAAQFLLQSQESLGRLRGRLLNRPDNGQTVLATYHPAYLLRQPSDKGACWQDIQVAMGFLGLSQ